MKQFLKCFLNSCHTSEG